MKTRATATWTPRLLLQARWKELGRRPGFDAVFRPECEGILETRLGPWVVAEVVEVHGGRRVVAEVRIYPAATARVQSVVMLGERGETGDDRLPDGGITARLLRTVRLRGAEPVIADYRKWVRRFFGADAVRRLDAPGVARRRRRRGVKKPHPTASYYAALARDYVSLLGRSRKPVADLAQMRAVPVEVIRSHIHLARRNRFLKDPPGERRGQGKAGGVLSARARRVLEG